MDYTLEETIYHAFTTRAFATGVPTALAGSPTLEIYENDNTTPIVEGASKLVLTQNLNSINGFNLATITATTGNGFEAGKTYHLIVKTGTVGGTSVVGEVVGRFTLNASASFTRLGAPAGASVSADIAAIEAQTDDIGAAGAGLTAVALTSAYDAAKTAATQTSVNDIPTNAELATALGTADDAILAAIAALNNVAATDIVSAGAITTSGGVVSADVKKVNAKTITGDGSATPFDVAP